MRTLVFCVVLVIGCGGGSSDDAADSAATFVIQYASTFCDRFELANDFWKNDEDRNVCNYDDFGFLRTECESDFSDAATTGLASRLITEENWEDYRDQSSDCIDAISAILPADFEPSPNGVCRRLGDLADQRANTACGFSTGL